MSCNARSDYIRTGSTDICADHAWADGTEHTDVPPARLAISVTIRAQLQATVPTTFVRQTDCALNWSALRLPAWCGRSIACCECYSVCYAMRCSPTGVG